MMIPDHPAAAAKGLRAHRDATGRKDDHRQRWDAIYVIEMQGHFSLTFIGTMPTILRRCGD